MRIFVPSLNRPHNVPTMNRLAGDAELVWLVPEWQADAYLQCGATHVVTGHPRKAQKTNAALDRFNDGWCVFSNDDCRGIVEVTEAGELHPITLDQAARTFVHVGISRRDRFVAMASISNQRYLTRTVSRWGLVTDWLFAVAPRTPERFDVRLPFGEDSDFAARICDRYGRIARINWIMGDYEWGGSSSQYDYRRRRASFALLCRRWPHLFSGYDDESLFCRPLPRYRVRPTPEVHRVVSPS